MNKLRSDIAFTPSVKAVQERLGSRKNYEQTEDESDWWLNRITPELADQRAFPGRDAQSLDRTVCWRGPLRERPESPSSPSAEALWKLEELHDLLELFFGLVHAGHI